MLAYPSSQFFAFGPDGGRDKPRAIMISTAGHVSDRTSDCACRYPETFTPRIIGPGSGQKSQQALTIRVLGQEARKLPWLENHLPPGLPPPPRRQNAITDHLTHGGDPLYALAPGFAVSEGSKQPACAVIIKTRINRAQLNPLLVGRCNTFRARHQGRGQSSPQEGPLL